MTRTLMIVIILSVIGCILREFRMEGGNVNKIIMAGDRNENEDYYR